MARNPVFWSRRGGASNMLNDCLEANSQSFLMDSVVYLNSAAVTAATHAGIEAATYKIAGLAARAATNVTTGNVEIPIKKIRAGDQIRIACTTGGTDKDAADFTVGDAYSIYIASNIAYVDHADTTNEVFKFIRPIVNANGSTSYEAIVEVQSAFLEFP